MAKTKKIKFELLVVTEGETKKSWTPSVFWRLIFTEADAVTRKVFTIAAIIIAYTHIIHSDDLKKLIFEWLINILIS